MSNNLVILGTTYSNAAGFKATDDQDNVLTFTTGGSAVLGTKSISANGTYSASSDSLDGYSEVTVAVPDSTLVITLSWDDDYFGQDEGAWVPDKTLAQIEAALAAGKEVTMQIADGWTASYAITDCNALYDGPNDTLVEYTVCYSGGEYVGDNSPHIAFYQIDQSTGDVVCDEDVAFIYPNFETKTVSYTPTTSQQTETITYDPSDGYNGIEEVSVTINAVPIADAYSGIASDDEFFTSGVNRRRWRIRPRLYVDDPGWVSQDSVGGWKEFSAVPSNTTITPTTSQQTVGGANYMMEGPVTVAAIPTGTEGTPTATKGSVSNHSISVTPSVTNTAGYISGGTHSGTAVTVSASELDSGTKSISANGTGIDVVGYAAVDVAVPATGVDIPIFTVTFSSNWASVISVTCNKTFVECYNYHENMNTSVLVITTDGVQSSQASAHIFETAHDGTAPTYIKYVAGADAWYDIIYTANGITIQEPSEYPDELTATENGTYDANPFYKTVTVNVPTGTARTSADLTVSGATVTVPAGLYSTQATKSVTSGSATPAASISATGATITTGTNTLTLSKSVSNTPQVSAGYVSSGTAGNSSVSLTATVNTRSSSDLTASGDTVTAPAGYYASAATKSVASGSAGTPTATKGTVSNHQVSVTPSVTNTTGYITGGTKTGSAVTVTAAELVSGTLSITSTATQNVTNYASATIDIPFSTITVSSSNPSGGSNGDIWIKTT